MWWRRDGAPKSLHAALRAVPRQVLNPDVVASNPLSESGDQTLTYTLDTETSRELVRLLFSQASKMLDSEHEQEVKEFLVRVFQLNELRRAFQRSPRGKIGGAQGVAAQLGLSRNAIYHWLKSAGLDAATVRSSPDLITLLLKSPLMQPTIDKLLPGGLRFEAVNPEQPLRSAR